MDTFYGFQELPLELQEQILSGDVTTLQQAPRLTKGYKELVGREYYKRVCSQPISGRN